MNTFLDHYKVLGVSVGAGIGDVTSSYKRLCRIYHPDINSDPESEELMKRINIAYAVLREKLKREALMRERTAYTRLVKRYPTAEARAGAAEARKASAESAMQAYTVIHNYFKAISTFDYSEAYNCLSAYDKRHITRESFIQWRKSVARLFPMREFTVDSDSVSATVICGSDDTLTARKFRVRVTEENLAEGKTGSGEVEKLVVSENGEWKVYLGYRNVYELTRTFDERFETRRKKDIEGILEEYYKDLCPEHNMLSQAGMRKEVSRELYRHKRFGGTLTFLAILIKSGGMREAGLEELLRSVAKTINSTLRKTDTPAYLGDSVFAILFVELKKKNAEEIVGRLAENIRKGAGRLLGERAEIKLAYETWSGSNPADMDALNRVLKKFSKKI